MPTTRSNRSRTAESAKAMRLQGWRVANVEKRLPGTVTTVDVWGFGDLLAVHVQRQQTALVQVTTLGHLKEHVGKAESTPEFHDWLNAGNLVIFHAWHKTRAGRWELHTTQRFCETKGRI